MLGPEIRLKVTSRLKRGVEIFGERIEVAVCWISTYATVATCKVIPIAVYIGIGT